MNTAEQELQKLEKWHMELDAYNDGDLQQQDLMIMPTTPLLKYQGSSDQNMGDGDSRDGDFEGFDL